MQTPQTKTETRGLVRPSVAETRNGWSPETLTEYLRGSLGPLEFFRECLGRSHEHAKQVAAAISRMIEAGGEESVAGKKHLAALKQDLSAAVADIEHAETALADAEKEERLERNGLEAVTRAAFEESEDSERGA